MLKIRWTLVWYSLYRKNLTLSKLEKDDIFHIIHQDLKSWFNDQTCYAIVKS